MEGGILTLLKPLKPLIDRYLKKLPFSLHTLTAMRGFQPRTASGGIVYVNGAARSGAVAKILQEVCWDSVSEAHDRSLCETELVAAHNIWTKPWPNSQSLSTDMTHSLLGQPAIIDNLTPTPYLRPMPTPYLRPMLMLRLQSDLSGGQSTA